jgi:hypothetical protein
MVSAVAGLLSPTLKAKLETQEAERSALVSDCAATDTPAVASLLARLARSTSPRVGSLQVRIGGMLSIDLPDVRLVRRPR